ncbi:hypothetical protein D3C80_1547480 [compost metagenome]
MVIVTLQREKCIGCNYCAELDPEHFRMSKKDGKSNLLHSVEKKGFHTVRLPHDFVFEQVEIAANACPVRIIKVSKI